MPATESPAGTDRHDRVHRQLLRFGAVGVMNGVIDLGVFNLLTLARPTHRSIVLAAYNTVAVIGAIANSYFWNSRWTFGRYRIDAPGVARNRRRALFLAQGVFNIGVNDAVVVGLAAFFGEFKVLPAAITNNMAKLVAMLVASLASFLAMRLVVFRAPPASRWQRRWAGRPSRANGWRGHESRGSESSANGSHAARRHEPEVPGEGGAHAARGSERSWGAQLPSNHPAGSASLDASVGPQEPRG